ncbi:MAG: DNA translocase FtsK 4TM domain-containing protein, partial [Actinomycetota bacterium]|nr:DNA translocase FtsK 4TM domain-containing protein [Actinomycetota bacterium]
MPSPRRTRKPPRGRKRAGGAWARPAMPVLDQHQRDVIGLGAVAIAAFLAFVLYLGHGGGQVGGALHDGLRFLLGEAAYLVPIGVLGAGVLLVLRPLLPAVQPFGAGGSCLGLGAALGLSAGTFGAGAGRQAHSPLLDPAYVSDRGGALGELLFWAARTLFSDVGAHILVVFLLLAGLLLVTGASIAGVVGATRRRVATTTERARRFSEARTGVLPSPDAPEAEAETRRARPPEVEPVVHATHVEAPALDAGERYPDHFDRDPEAAPEGEADGVCEAPIDEGEQPACEDAPTGDEPEPAEEELTPMGNRRSGVTEADQLDYMLPSGSVLRHARAKQKPNTAEGDRIAAQLVEALGHFGVDAKVVGSVSGPHVTRYELRLAPGIKMSKVA